MPQLYGPAITCQNFWNSPDILKPPFLLHRAALLATTTTVTGELENLLYIDRSPKTSVWLWGCQLHTRAKTVISCQAGGKGDSSIPGLTSCFALQVFSQPTVSWILLFKSWCLDKESNLKTLWFEHSVSNKHAKLFYSDMLKQKKLSSFIFRCFILGKDIKTSVLR